MEKTQIYLGKEELEGLRKTAARSKRSMVALVRDAIGEIVLKPGVFKSGAIKILPCEPGDLEQSWEYFRRADLHKLTAVHATSFAIMKRARIRIADTFDHCFAAVGSGWSPSTERRRRGIRSRHVAS